MRLAPKPIDFGERDGFEGTDIFGYEEFGTNLASLVENLEGPSVIALDGGWGSGKTVFAKQWAGLLRTRGSAVIYFDAFAADSGDDPLFDIASQLFAAAPDGEERTDLAKAAGVFARRFLPVVAGVGLRAATGGLIGGEAISEGAASAAAAKDAARDRAEETSEAFRQRIECSQDRADALSNFRQKLTALVETMKAKALADGEEASGASKSRPVVMIVDELDRCKPSYALDVLENIKHVFDVDTLCFVLVVNCHQLDRTVGTLYGVESGHKYFEKFFHLTVKLPSLLRRTNTSTRGRYLRYLSQNMLAVHYQPIDRWIEWMLSIAEYRDWSLRTLERMMRGLEVCLSPGQLELHDPRLAVIVCSLHADAQDMYSKLRSGTITRSDLEECLGIEKWDQPRHRERFQEILEECFPAGPNAANPEGRAYPDRAVIGLCDLLDRMGQRDPRA